MRDAEIGSFRGVLPSEPRLAFPTANKPGRSGVLRRLLVAAGWTLVAAPAVLGAQLGAILLALWVISWLPGLV